MQAEHMTNSTEDVSLHYLLLSLCHLHLPELVWQIPSTLLTLNVDVSLIFSENQKHAG